MEIKKLESYNLEEYMDLRIKMLKESLNNDYNFAELEKQTRKYFIENLNNTLFIFGMFDNDKLIAVSGIEILKRLPTPQNLACMLGYICGVYTDIPYRKQGISKKLINKTLEFGKSLGITRFNLNSHNPIAINMYRGFGFEHNEKAMILDT